MTMTIDNNERFSGRELLSDRLRCLECGAYKDETPGEWLIDAGVVACPDCRTEFDASVEDVSARDSL